VRLSDHLVKRHGAQALGERGATGEALGAVFVEKVHERSISLTTPSPSSNASEKAPGFKYQVKPEAYSWFHLDLADQRHAGYVAQCPRNPL
jgi:hypothetical protein